MCQEWGVARHTGLVAQPVPLSAEYFDGWYANMASSGISDEIQQRHLGLPAYVMSTSLLTWDGVGDVTRALQLAADSTLLTGWEALDPDDERIPARIRQISFAAGLAGAGFSAVEGRGSPGLARAGTGDVGRGRRA